MTLEELDSTTRKACRKWPATHDRRARFLDEIVSGLEADIAVGAPLGVHGRREAGGRLFLQTEAIAGDLPRACRSARPTTRSSVS
jgi:PhoH-like ATPase